MSWEIATVTIAVLGTITAAIIRFVPVRHNPGSGAALAVLQNEMANLRRSHEELRTMVSDMNKMLMDWMKAH